MTQSVSHVTIATSSGAVWLALVLHFGAGLVAIATGFLAIVTTKGGRWHRKAGTVFTVAMIATGILAAVIAVYEGKLSSVIGGIFTAYLIFTAYTTVRPLTGPHTRDWSIALMVLALALASWQFGFGVIALGRPGMLGGVPIGMVFFLATVTLLAGIGDWRLLRAGGSILGARRLARHLWRMCFGLFIATGSFFLGQMKFIPRPLRIGPLIVLLAVAPLLVLLYWMWRGRAVAAVSGGGS